MVEQRVRVAVIGAGMGGLATAIALDRVAGAEVTVFEQARQLGEVGAGVALAPNGQRVLEYLGLLDAVKEVTAMFDGPGTYQHADGTYVGEQVWTDSSGAYHVRGLHRADLIDILGGAVPSESLRLGHKLTGLDIADSHVEVRFENGVRESFDAVIGADGIHSVVRDSITKPSNPIYSGSIAYRGVLDAARVPENWPMTLRLWMGDGKHFMCYPVRQRRLFNWVGFVPSDRPLKESWSAVGDVKELAREFEGWDPELREFISRIEKTFWWGLYDREPLSSWTKGRVALLGDAAHPMLPHAGQGVNQALEDSLALAIFLKGVESDRIAAAVKRYALVRMQRTAMLQSGSRKSGARYDSQGDYEDLEKRDTEVLNARDFRQRVMYDYDAVAAAQSAL